MAALRDMARDDSGLVFTTVLTIVGVTSAALGLWGTGEAINNKMTTDEAAANMEAQAQLIQQRTEGDDSAQAQNLKQNAEIMTQAAGKMKSEANWDVAKNVVTNVMDIATAPISATSKVGLQVVKVGWDGYTGWNIGQGAFDAVSDPKPDTSSSMAILAQAQPYPGNGDGQVTKPDYQSGDPVEGFIFETKQKVMGGEVSSMYPDAEPALVDDLSTSLVIDLESDRFTSDETEVQLTDGNPFTWSVDSTLSKIDPNNPTDVEMGQVKVTSEDQQALESGQKTEVIGEYFGANGWEPVIVSGDSNDGLMT